MNHLKPRPTPTSSNEQTCAARVARGILPARFLFETTPLPPSCSFVLTFVVSTPLTLFFFIGGSFSSTPSALSRALLRFGNTPAPFIPIGSSGERVSVIDISSYRPVSPREYRTQAGALKEHVPELYFRSHIGFQYISWPVCSQ